MSKFFKAAIIGLTLIGTVSAAEALPVTSLGSDAAVVSGAQIEKTVVIVTKRVVRRRPAVIRKTIIVRRRPMVRRPLVRLLRHL